MNSQIKIDFCACLDKNSKLSSMKIDAGMRASLPLKPSATVYVVVVVEMLIYYVSNINNETILNHYIKNETIT